MTAHADYRQRSQIEITRDLIAACLRIGDIGLQSEMAMTPPDAGELTRAHEGLGAVLREQRAANQEGKR